MSDETKDTEVTKVDDSSSIADSSIFHHFQNELDQLNSVENELDELYYQVKEHYDSLVNTRGKISPSFIQGQTANLITMKTTKINIIKERVNLKRNIIDFGFKKQLRETENTGDEAIIQGLLKQVLKSEADDKRTIIDAEYGDITGGPSFDEVSQQLVEDGSIEFNDNELNPNVILNVDEVIDNLVQEQMSKTDKSNQEEVVPEEITQDIPEEERHVETEEEFIPVEEETVEEEYIEDSSEDELPYEENPYYEEEDLPFEELPYEEEEISSNIEVVIGMSRDRQRWEFLAYNNETGELELDYPLPDKDNVMIKITKVGEDLRAFSSQGENYKVFIVDFDDEENEELPYEEY